MREVENGELGIESMLNQWNDNQLNGQLTSYFLAPHLPPSI